jgi:hypothetical protein
MSIMRRSQVTIIVLSVAIGALLPAGASAETSSSSVNRDVLAPLYAKMKQRFTTRKPGTSTGWIFDGEVIPFPEGEQVPPQRVLHTVYPRGTEFDLKTAKGKRNCTATDEEITAEGVGACPSASQVGSGNGMLFLGLLGTWDVDAYLFTARPGFALVVAAESGTVLKVIRMTIDGNEVTGEITPSAPLPGGYQPAFTQFFLRTEESGTKRHPGLRTPDRCPKSGRWKFTYLPEYVEPYGVQRSTSTMPCKRRKRS